MQCQKRIDPIIHARLPYLERRVPESRINNNNNNRKLGIQNMSSGRKTDIKKKRNYN